jgi:hypothetical protein
MDGRGAVRLDAPRVLKKPFTDERKRVTLRKLTLVDKAR